MILVPKETQASFHPEEEICKENPDMTSKQSQQLVNSMYPEVSKFSKVKNVLKLPL